MKKITIYSTLLIAILSLFAFKNTILNSELIKIEGTTAYFNGLTYSRKENELTIKLNLHSGDKKWVEEFTFKKTEL